MNHNEAFSDSVANGSSSTPSFGQHLDTSSVVEGAKDLSRVEALLVWLLQVDSVTKQEESLLQAVSATFTKWYEAESSDGPQVSIRVLGKNLVVEVVHNPALPTIGLVGHLDTVPGNNNVFIDEQRIGGLGASDMKSGVAVMMELLHPSNHQISASDPAKYNLTGIFYCGEEGLYLENSLHELFELAPELSSIDFAFVLEPTDNELHVGCIGTINARVHFSGTRAHSARPWEGRNAIYKAAGFIQRVAAETTQDVEIGGVTFREVISTTLIDGGVARNVIPDSCVVNVNCRFSPDRSTESATNYLHGLVQDEGRLEMFDICPAGTVPVGNELYEAFKTFSEAPLIAQQAYTDVSILSSNDVDCVNFGPGVVSQMHQEGEWSSREQLAECLTLLQEFLFQRTTA